MAIQLPKYNKQVKSGGNTEVMADPNTHSSAIGLMSSLGSTGISLGREFISKMKEHKEQGDSARYSADLKTQLPQFIDNARAQGKLKGIKEEDMFEQAVKPAIDQFYESQMEQGYSKSVQNIIAKDYEFQHNKYMAQEEGIALENEIIRSNVAKIDLANAMRIDGDYEGADKVLDTLQMPPDQIASEKRKGFYNMSLNELNSMNDPKRIEEFSKDDALKRMSVEQYQQFQVMATNRVKKLTAEKYAPAKAELKKQHSKGEMTEESIRAMGLPKNEEGLYLKMLNDDISQFYTENELLTDELTEKVDKFLAGDYAGGSTQEYDNLLADLAEAEIPASVKMDLLAPIIDNQVDPSRNAPFFTNKENAKVYDNAIAPILNLYRDSYNAANTGLTASERIYGFGNGYRDVMSWIEDNKSDIKSGKVRPNDIKRVISEAVQPTVTRRVELNKARSDMRILRGEEVNQFDEFWGE